MGGDISQEHLATLQFDEEQHIPTPQAQCFHAEEVTSQDARGLGAQELDPSVRRTWGPAGPGGTPMSRSRRAAHGASPDKGTSNGDGRTRSLCQRSKVAGVTRKTAQRSRGRRRANIDSRRRSGIVEARTRNLALEDREGWRNAAISTSLSSGLGPSRNRLKRRRQAKKLTVDHTGPNLAQDVIAGRSHNPQFAPDGSSRIAAGRRGRCGHACMGMPALWAVVSSCWGLGFPLGVIP